MTDYKCGCKTDGVVILDDNELSLTVYFEWAENVGVFGTKEMCFDCWLKQSGR